MKHANGTAKRILSAILAVLMVFSMVTSTFAAGEWYENIALELVEAKGVSAATITKQVDVGSDATVATDDTCTVEMTVTLEEGYEIYDLILVQVDGTGSQYVVPYSKEGENVYTFVAPYGTYSEINGNGAWYKVYVSTSATDEYELRFTVDGALYAYDRVKTDETPTTPTENPVKDGYTFTGWKTKDGADTYSAGAKLPELTGDTTYEAVFESNKYTVTYYRGKEGDESKYKTILTVGGTDTEMHDDNEGKILYQDNVYGSKIVLGSVALPGYEFKGWQDENGTIYSAGATYTVKGDVTLTALWAEKTAKDCWVIFESDGAIYDAFLAYEGQTVSIPTEAPTKPGYEFKGWKNGDTTYAQNNKTFEVISDDNREMVFTAEWEEVTYSVSYSDGVTEIKKDEAQKYGDYIIAKAPTKEGSTFVAWKDADGAYYSANTRITLDRDLELTAVWLKNEADKYLVKFYAEDGSLYDLYIVDDGETVTAPAYTAGKTSAKYYWYNGVDTYIEVETELTVTSDLAYTAVVKSEPVYEVKVNIVGTATNVTSFVNGTSFKADDVVSIALTIPDGYTLKSVYGLAGKDTPLVDSLIAGTDAGQYTYYFTMEAADAEIYVELEEIPAGKTVVKFVSDGQVYDSIIATKGQNATAPTTAPTKVGSTFEEWKSGDSVVSAGGSFKVATDAADEIVYTAVWEKEEYTVSFDEVGGTPDSADVQKYYGDEIQLPEERTKVGYTFLGWQERSTGFIYGAEATYTVTGNAQFTALWEEIPANVYVVKFVDEAGIIYGYETVEEGEQVVAPAGPVIAGKEFTYWKSSDGREIRAKAETGAITEDTVFVAQFDISTYSINKNQNKTVITLDTTANIPVGTKVSFKAVAEVGCEMSTVVLSYTDALGAATKVLDLTESGEYSFTMPNSDVTIIATAVKNEFALRADDATGTEIKAAAKATAGELVKFTVDITDEDYVLTNVYVVDEDGNPITLIKEEDKYVFTMPYSDVTIKTESAKAEYSVTYLDSDNTLLGIEAVNSGDRIANAPAPTKDGYEFSGWEILPDGKILDAEIYEITADTVLRATYKGVAKTVAAGLSENLHTFQANCTVSNGNANSSDLLQTKLSAEAGKTVYFKVAAKYDYVITDVAVVSAAGTNLVVEPILREKEVKDEIVYYTYAFTMPAENVKIDVYTAPKTYTVSVEENIPTGGAYTVNGFYTNNLLVALGEQVAVAIEPAAGYVVEKVTAIYTDNYGNTSNVGELNDNVFSFEMVAKDVTVKIEYKANAYEIDVQTSNFESYKPFTEKQPVVAVESLDEALTSKGKITVNDVEDVDHTNEENHVYKIPANGEAKVGEEVSFKVETFTGYELESVAVTYDEGKKTCMLTKKGDSYYFTMPAADVKITAVYDEITSTVTKAADAEAHGEVTINGLIENKIAADYKDSVTVNVTPDKGWYVKSITYTLDNDKVLDFSNGANYAGEQLEDKDDDAQELKFTMPASDVTVNVTYEKIDFSIAVVKDDVTTVDVVTSKNMDDQVTFTTKVDPGYVIDKVYVVNEETNERVAIFTDTVSKDAVYGAEYYFTMPASKVTIHVTAIKDTFDVIYTDAGGYIGGEEVKYKESANVTDYTDNVVNAQPGYHFVGWASDEIETPIKAPNYSNVNNDFIVINKTFITAVYEKDEIGVLYKAVKDGKVNGKTEETRVDTTVFGDEVTFTAVADTGYVIDKVSVTSTDADGYNLDIRYTEKDGTYIFKIPATYKKDVHTAQAEDVVVEVTFKKDTFTLTESADSEDNGTVAINGKVTTQTSFTYDYYADVTITATPAEGYYVKSVSVKGDKFTEEKLGSAPTGITGEPLTLTFKMPAENVTFTVDYEKIDYTITLDAIAEQGKIETVPADTTTVGELVNVTVTPEYGYNIANVSVAGKSTGKHIAIAKDSNGKYHFAMPAEDVTVQATFSKNVYTVKFYDWNGTILAIEEVDYLDAAPAPADPARVGYTFTGWDKDFSSITKNISVIAQYKILVSDVNTASISFTGVEHGKVSVPGGTTAEFGSVVTVVADPDDGWRVNKISVLGANGKYVPVSFVKEDADYVETYSFVMPENAVSITVSFEEHAASRFVDCRTDDWYYEAVEFVTDRGYFIGVSETKFAPNADMTRAMFVTVLARLNGVDLTAYKGVTPYKDVDVNSYYAPALEWATSTGVINGYSATEFGPDDSITREQICTMMYRYCKYMGSDMTVKNTAFMNRYTDTDQIDAWAKTSVEWAVGVGLIHGCTETTINPKEHATRAQVAQIIRNLCDKEIYE